jgi:DNA repair protein RAD50
LDELRRLQGQINTKATERSTLFTLQQQQYAYAALSEENEGKVEALVFPCSQYPNMITAEYCFV